MTDTDLKSKDKNILKKIIKKIQLKWMDKLINK